MNTTVKKLMPPRPQAGFTLMEIVVATTIFAGVLTLMLTLFNYTIKINRRSEALRQANQAVRNLTEFFIKEVRNGKIDYASTVSPCNGGYVNAQGYTSYVAITNIDSIPECFYLSGGVFYLVKNGGTAQAVNPAPTTITGATITIDSSSFRFFVRPPTDPYTTSPKVQPFVSLVASFNVKLPTGEQVTIPYQTSISTRIYDLPQ